uniref:Histone-lysine N-methyltransferase n=1 Tax=Clastoptera arizonana TaxID=38151 RepID=A0A1B6E0P6_9HEMI
MNGYILTALCGQMKCLKKLMVHYRMYIVQFLGVGIFVVPVVAKKGASVGCCNKNCPEAYHFLCAKSSSCIFLDDKAVYCTVHESEADESKLLHQDSEYPVLRPVYVELERKKKKFVPKEEVKLKIGSLTIENIGVFVPEVSDKRYSIIPNQFACTRLFWSSLEPWRVVKYRIQTKVIHSVLEYSVENDDNYTVDHSLDSNSSDPNKPKNDERINISVAGSKTNKQIKINIKESDVKKVIDNILDSICSKEDEQQGDLLPPELKDAIFEDLPGDLLDGISMQDIFPKLMNFDDLSLIDSKNDKEYKYDSNSDVESVHCSKKIKLDADDSSTDNKISLLEINYENGSAVQKKSDIKRSRISEISQAEKETAGKLHKSQIPQVDGAEDCSSESDLGSFSMDDSHCNPVLHVRIQKTESYENKPEINCGESNILQLDGTVDCFSCSESSSPPHCDSGSDWSSIEQLDGTVDSYDDDIGEEKPVKCARCHRTYRTAQSFERHLQTCSVDYILSCSESDSSEEEKISCPVEGITEPETLAPNTLYTLDRITEAEEDNATAPQVIECVYQPSQNKISNINGINDSPNNKISNLTDINGEHLDTLDDPNSIIIEDTVIDVKTSEDPQFTNIDSGFDDTQITAPCNKNNFNRTRIPRTYTRRKKSPAVSTPQTMSTHTQGVIEYPTNSPVSNSTLILQQVPTQNVIPTYVDSFSQQSSSHNIQYIATIDSHDKTQYLTSNAIMPGTFQLQSTPIGLQPIVPTVLGTIIQSNGIEQLVVNAPTPTVEVFNQQPTGMFITSSPMYVGMETVVSNTVMSSSQFVSGMLAASSYSATTTQVYQTAKPVVEGYVVVNAPTNVVNTTPIQPTIPENIYAATQPSSLPWSYNYQAIKEQTTYQAVTTRQIIHEEKNIDCVSMLNSQKTIVFDNPVAQEVIVETEPEVKPLGPVHELRKMVDNIEPNERFSSGGNNNKLEYHHSLSNITLDKQEPVYQKVSDIDCKEKRDHIAHNCNKTSPVTNTITSDQNIETTHSQPIKITIELPSIKKVNGKRLPSKISQKDTSKFNKSKDIINRVPLCENKIFKNHSENKPKKTNTLVKNSSGPQIIYEIQSQDGFSVTSSSFVEGWQKVFNAVQAARAAKKLPLLPQNPFLSELKALGLDNNSVKYVLEQLPGVGHCVNYKPVFHKQNVPVVDSLSTLQANQTGCARSEPFTGRRKHDMFSWLASRHRRPPKLLVDSDIVNGVSRRATSVNLPMAMRFRHLRETSKEAVGVFRSDIHGRGLFCLRDIDAQEMVIEYAGEVIRSGLTDIREKHYTSKGIGCYMFRIDDQFVVDATMKGNAARFINHSCEPNCYSRVIDILGKKHILIFAFRRIPQGEELTYDYKFPFEDEKITCHCLSRKCRKYLN